MAEKTSERSIAANRKAGFNYFITEKYEAGIVLTGTEVKSVRDGKVDLKDSFAGLDNGELFLYNMHISPYIFGSYSNTDPLRKRKLLLHRTEINRLSGRLSQGNLTIVPLRIYLKGNIIKLEVGLAKSKRSFDKRESIKKKETEREIRKNLKAN
ncbi:MAG: SsrA-binding protein SmpB [Candidatus Firestonebacteria bacterium]